MRLAKRKSKLRAIRIIIAFWLVFGVCAFMLFTSTRAETPGAKPFYYRVDRVRPLAAILGELDNKGVLKSYRATRILGVLKRSRTRIAVGTYLIGPGMSAGHILDSLESPVHQMLTLPQNLWASRLGKFLERKEVCTADEYVAAAHDPTQFQSQVTFPLPKDSLEGYLLPDTYDLPPLIGASAVVERQLKAFERKVWEPLGKPADIQTILTKASLIELEVARDEERPLVASVIENRLKKKMALQIDASVNYALGVWRPLTFKDLREAKGPYNLYRAKGLPPGPICSPSLKSIEAAMHPETTNYLFYVALPDGHSLFAATWAEHQKNIAKRKAALAARAKERALTR